ncbi:MAG: rRNA cytosine-C5-methyltransferase [Candidatus Cryptobacteroides sp.]|nr:rRNA cytosine-C5-methyltransferase [Candidatus Cryptobacteroides sp.]
MDFSPAFRKYLAQVVGEGNLSAVLDALSGEPSVSVRINPAKAGSPSEIFGNLVSGPVEWNRHAAFLSERPAFTLDPLIHAGAYYVQDSSAMFPGKAFRDVLDKVLESGIISPKVLDLCAAPGGKTTDISASLRESCKGGYLLISNEIMKQRAAVLADNAAVWGDPSVVVTSVDPKAFGTLPGFFDIIVADVPCSGEGMFRKDDEAVSQWSEENVALCQARQRRIVADVWPSLAEGGFLVYSTCTFNNLENDDNVKWICSEFGAEIIGIDSCGLLRTECGVSLVPGFVRGEGQYCAVLRKTSPSAGTAACSGRQQDRWQKLPEAHASIIRPLLDEEMAMIVKDGRIVAVPEYVRCLLSMLEPLRPLARGLAVGMFKGKDFIPDADLALSLSLRRGAFNEFEVNRETALSFLHRDPVRLPDAERGMLLLVYRGLPIGFVKNLGNRCNSLHPLHRRIRMDI